MRETNPTLTPDVDRSEELISSASPQTDGEASLIPESGILTTGGLIAANSVWSVAGDLAPMLVAIISIPILIHALGVPEFGILSVAWTLVIYTAFFDFGLSRAVTKLVADKVAARELAEVPHLFWDGLVLTILFSLIGSGLLALSCSKLVHLLNVPHSLDDIALQVFRVVALTVPVVVTSSTLQGYLAGFQRFDLITAVRIPASISVFLSPLLILPFSHNLVLIVMLLLATRVLAGAAYLILCLKLLPTTDHRPGRSNHGLRQLLAFGGWITVSNCIVPMMLYSDRFLIGGLLSISAVTYYVAPYEAITKLIIIPSATARAFFPAFAEGFALSPVRVVRLLDRGTNLILLIVAPAVLLACTFAPTGLRMWLGASFAFKSTPVLRWLAIGVLFNATAQLPYALIQAAHRPDLTAKLSVLEVPFFIVTALVLIRLFGIEGAAIAWCLRVVLDTLALWIIVHWLLPAVRPTVVRTAVAITVTLCLTALGVWLFVSVMAQSIYLISAVTLSFSGAWIYLLTREDKALVARWVPISLVSRVA